MAMSGNSDSLERAGATDGGVDVNADEWVVRDAKSLGAAIGANRRSKGLTQAELAESAALHRSYLSNLEQGKATEQTDRLFRVIRRLGLEVVVRKRSGR